MFGHQDEPVQQDNAVNNQPAPVDPAYSQAAPNPALPPAGMDFGAPAAPAPGFAIPPASPVPPTSLLEPQATDGFTGAPSTPVQDQPVVTDFGASTPGPLNDLKQQALQQLSPLVSQLDQTPEEKFRTTMMMIQASDNQDLLQVAYDAANQITDEKAKAQALLDVINEINYFTQK